MAMATIRVVKTIPAGKFKDVCLKTLDDVARTRSAVVITKRGRPVAKLVPVEPPAAPRGLAGSVIRETGDPFGSGESWDADPA
jgi:prevent-host-death family protein